jgi:ribosomal protein S18 acetylase RimI-like enzyme
VLKPDPERFPLTIRRFRKRDAVEVVSLWRRCDLLRPANDPFKDIERKQEVGQDLFLVALLGERIAGSVMAGYEGHRGWINYLSVDPGERRRGIGRRLMEEAERLLHARGCPKINLQVRTSNAQVIKFYAAIGFARDDVICMGKRLVKEGPSPGKKRGSKGASGA